MPVKRKNRKGQTEWFGRVVLPNGNRVERRCRTKREALAWEGMTLARNQDINTIDTDCITMATFIERYMDHVLARGLADKTYNEKRRCFRLMFKDINPALPVVDIKYGAVEAFLDKFACNVSGHRANKFRQHIVRAYNWGIRALGLPEPNPWRIERYKEVKRPRRVPTIEEFWKVYDQATEEQQRLLLVFLHTAGRRNEVFNLKKDDVDFEHGRLRQWTKKRTGGLEPDWLPMTDELTQTLKRQRLANPFQEYFFVNPETRLPWTEHGRLMPRLCEKAEVEPFGFHGIRHLSASILDSKGFPLATIQAVLRHKSSHTTARYLHSLKGAKIELGQAFSRNTLERQAIGAAEKTGR